MTAGASPALVAGAGGLPKVVLSSFDGARIEVYAHGAHVTSWRAAGSDDERLFVSPLSHFVEDGAIRGGVPVCFPQFADQGPLPMHGFARTRAWGLVSAGRAEDGAAHARLRLADAADTRALWPHAFECVLDVVAKGPSLTVELAVVNTGGRPFDFTAALHTYLRTSDVRTAEVRGLAGAPYRDKVLKRDDEAQRDAVLVVDRPIDRVYRTVPSVLEVREPRRALEVRARGTTDTVVWNPGPGGPSDLAPDGYLSMLCVEAAVASTTIALAPGQAWRGAQTLTAVA